MRAHSVWRFGLAGLALLATTAIRWPRPFSERGRPAEVERGNPQSHDVALTFDAGGETAGLAELLAALEVARVHCTFFLTGHWATQHPDLAAMIHDRGHEIGNHTWSHPDLTHLPEDRVRSEIWQADQVLSPINGRSPRPLWRAPYGARDARVLKIASELGYTSIYWTLDSLDSVGEHKTPAFLIHRIMGRQNSELQGAIILMHVGEPTTAQAVPAILEQLKQRGFTMVTVSRLLGAS